MDLFLKFLVALLLAFTPFSFAATEPWAFSVLQGLLIGSWICWLATRRTFVYTSVTKPVLYVFGVLIGFCLIQSFFPQTLLDPIVGHPITLMRLYTLEHASLFVTYMGVVLLVGQVFPSFDQIKQLMWMLVTVAVLVALCAWAFPQGQYVAKLTGITQYTSAIGPFVNRNHAGLFFALNALLALGLFSTHQLHKKQVMGVGQGRAFIGKQLCLTVIAIGLMAATVCTRSRGAMLSLLVGLLGYAFLCVWYVPHQFKKRINGFFCILACLLILVGGIYTHVEQINAFAHRRVDASAQTRKMLYRAAENMLKQYPVWGIGVGALPVVITSYTEWDVHQYIEHAHNDWLELLVGVGIVGAGLVLVGIIGFIVMSLKRLKHLETKKQFVFASFLSALLAMSVGSLVDFHFFIPGCALVFFMILGAVVAPTFNKPHVHAVRWPILVKILLMFLLMAASWIPLQKTRCWRQFFIGKGLKIEHKQQAYEQGLAYYPGPRYAARLAKAYYKEALHVRDPMIKIFYFEQAQQLAQIYLEKYPKEKELSALYVQASRHLR